MSPVDPEAAPAARRRATILAGYGRPAGATSAGTGDRAVAEHDARAALTDPDATVRIAAMGALERLDALRPHDLARAIADSDSAVRRRAAEATARRPGNRSPSLGALLADVDASVVEVAAWASGERRPPEPGVVARLSALATGHDDALCREAAVAALGAIGDEQGLPAILTATRDRATVRRRAVIALAPFEGPEVEAALDTARHDRDWQVRQAAEDLLSED
jgi:HEAT repeat protein